MIPVGSLVQHFRQTEISGQCIDLVPYDTAFDADVVRLRADPKVMHFMNMAEEPNENAQAAWRAGYEARTDDVMWMVREKSGRVCGTTRLYDIGEEIAEKGSLIIDNAVSRLLPAALEAEVLLLNLGFDDLGLNRIITRVRLDNQSMISINKRFGFSPIGDQDIRGIRYGLYALDRPDWDPGKFTGTIAHWGRRFSA